MKGWANDRCKAGCKLLAATALALAAATAAQAQATPAATLPSASAPAQSQLTPGERRVVVSLPDRKLALVENGRVVKVYSIAVGAPGSPTPVGQFKIINRLTDPTYYSPGVVISPGKDNPLGTRWMGINKKRFGIHGTNEPQSIGRRASHGCIRMNNRDAEELFERVRAGDTVELVGQRTVELAAIFGAPEIPAAKPAAPAASVAVVVAAVIP